VNRIVFVDDESRVLSGLRRQLFGRRDEWDMAFVESGPAALEDLARTPADAIVSDMRMPGMDGAQLLAQVARLHPRTARLVLSGHADADRVQIARSCAHRYLHKPCPPETLQAEVTRALAVRAMLARARWPLAERVWCTPPSNVPAAARAFSALSESADAEAVAAEVERQLIGDPTLRVRVSALLADGSAPRRCVLPVVLAVHCFDTFATGEAAEAFGRAAALAARMTAIAATEKLPIETVAHAAAAVVLPTASGDPQRVPLLEYLLPTWGFPEAVVAAAVHAGEPAACPQPHAGPLALLCAAELLLGWTDPARTTSPSREAKLEAWLKDRGWSGLRQRWPAAASLRT
jgi:CheY-like chemotaxis protein